MRTVLALLLVLTFASSAGATIPWPTEPFAGPHQLGNNYGEYQNYGSSYYLHNGIDIMEPAGTPVYAVKAGWVKAVLTTSGNEHWRVAIGDSATAAECDGWLYAHLQLSSITVSIGDYVDSGQYLGDIVFWPVYDFHHIHFAKIRHSGFAWSSDWEFVGNPLDELANIEDPDAPYFVEIAPGYPFKFCVDNSNQFFEDGAALTGNVDIVAQAHDLIGHPDWVLQPYALTYQIQSDSLNWGPTTAFVFTGELLYGPATFVVYKASDPCVSAGNYDERQFFEIVTNHDGDSLITLDDTTGCWATGQVPNGDYMITVSAYDRAGNSASRSMTVTTANFYEVAGVVSFPDGNPILSGVEVQIVGTATSEATDESGAFDFGIQPAGRYQVTAGRAGYETWSEITEFFSPLELNIELLPGPYLNGDVDNDGLVNISDAVYLIRYIFSSGPYPVVWAAATNIDPSPLVNITDAVYLINYIFNGGPAPGEGTP